MTIIGKTNVLYGRSIQVTMNDNHIYLDLYENDKLIDMQEITIENGKIALATLQPIG